MSETLKMITKMSQGSSFTVVVEPTRDEESVEASLARPKQIARASILVVDDEPAIGRILARTLKGHEVRCVTNAREALELLESGGTFDIIFSDLMMPDMSGIQLYEEVESRFPPLKDSFVFVTGGALTATAHNFLDEVASPVLAKPFSIGAVRDLVQLMIGGDRAH
ncbi:MAG: CheY-like chemotaxis protein [Polyangiales bacterium]|jgi:CheY-like chemotaxis protein